MQSGLGPFEMGSSEFGWQWTPHHPLTDPLGVFLYKVFVIKYVSKPLGEKYREICLPLRRERARESEIRMKRVLLSTDHLCTAHCIQYVDTSYHRAPVECSNTKASLTQELMNNMMKCESEFNGEKMKCFLLALACNAVHWDGGWQPWFACTLYATWTLQRHGDKERPQLCLIRTHGNFMMLGF